MKSWKREVKRAKELAAKRAERIATRGNLPDRGYTPPPPKKHKNKKAYARKGKYPAAY
jgi:hypothetical protein